jgi:hypothetical protein
MVGSQWKLGFLCFLIKPNISGVAVCAPGSPVLGSHAAWHRKRSQSGSVKFCTDSSPIHLLLLRWMLAVLQLLIDA